MTRRPYPNADRALRQIQRTRAVYQYGRYPQRYIMSIDTPPDPQRRHTDYAAPSDVQALESCVLCGTPSKTWEIRQGLLLCEPCVYEEGQPYCATCGATEGPWGAASSPLQCGACCPVAMNSGRSYRCELGGPV